MAKINSMMNIGKRAMMNSQTALATTAHNIANKSTEGYSRQRVDIVSSPSTDGGNVRIGNGARAAEVTRTVNPWLERQIEKEGTTSVYADTKAEATSKLESIFNESTNKGINFFISEFFNSFRELSTQPDSTAMRAAVKESAEQLVDEFKRVNAQLDGVRDDLNTQIEYSVAETNELTKEIAQLNGKIQQIEISGHTANDERDRRDLLLKKLSEKLDITYSEDPKSGGVSITAGRNAILVTGTSSVDLYTSRDEDNKTQIYFPLSSKGMNINISNQFTKGRIGAALEVRDKNVEKIRNDMDVMAYSLTKEVNRAHIEGYDKYNKKGVLFFDMPGLDAVSIEPQDFSGEVTEAFEQNKLDIKGFSKNLSLNATIRNDGGRISAAASAGAPGDNTVANIIHNIQFAGVVGETQSNFDDFYNAQVAEIGIVTQRANKSAESQKNIMTQLSNMRESVSGVSLDEEAARMIEFQKSYEASARLIKVADEMFDTVLSLKRL